MGRRMLLRARPACCMAASLIVFLGSALGIGAATAVGVPEEPSTTAAPSVPSFPSQARLRFLSALATLRSEDWSAAAREFGDRSWADTPLSEYARLYEAESRLKAGDNVAARAAMLRSAEIMAEGRLAPSALLEAATLLQAAGEDATAVTLVRRFLDRHRDHAEAPRARLLLGQSLLAQGLVSDAARAFNDLRILSPAAPETAVASEQLRVLIEQGLGGPPPSPRERIERAERLLAAGFGEAAKSEAEELLTDGLPPELAGRALKIVFDVARRGGRYEAALAVVKRALSSLSPTRRPGWLLELARLQQRRSVEQALTTLDRLGREYSKSSEAGEALLLKARLLEDAGRLGQARAAYAKLAAEYSEHDDAGVALWRLGWLAWFRTAYAEAGGTWARLLTIPGGHAYHESAKYWIGRTYDQRGDAGAAARHFAELVAEAPRSYYGILAAQRGGRAPSPRVASPVVLPTDPFEPLQAHPSYVRVEALRAVALGDFADEELAEMTRRAVGEPELLYGLAAAFVRESRYHLALRILRRHFFSLARSGFDATPRAFWEIFYPIGWRGELMEAASRAALDPFFVAAVVREESSFYPRARSRVGARGLMQLMPDTARRLAVSRRLTLDDPDRLDDPATNLELGTTYLAGLVREFGDPRLAAAAYNAGPTRVREWWSARRSEDLEVFVEQIPFNETRAFVKRVILAWDEYRRLYGAPITIERADARPRSVAP